MSEANYLLAQIKQHADEQYRAGHTQSAPTALKVYGVRVPVLRKIARDWYRGHKLITDQELLALMEALWTGESREERAIALHLLEHFERRISLLTQAHFDRWRRTLDNWEMTDGLGWVLGLWQQTEPDTRLDYLWELIADEDVWSRRLALVAAVRINRGKAGFTIPDLTLQLVDRVKEERHPMITKVVSWALRGMIKPHREQVVAYLEKNRDALAAHVVREVSNKLRTGLKSGTGKKS
ncbi:MAG: DNA alkylation repair protein [Anaerolineales bacterium]